jgi:hypothetical protein
VFGAIVQNGICRDVDGIVVSTHKGGGGSIVR